jgi:hypothetical protein
MLTCFSVAVAIAKESEKVKWKDKSYVTQKDLVRMLGKQVEQREGQEQENDTQR